MSKYGMLVLILLGAVILAALVTVGVQAYHNGTFSGFSTLIQEHRDWLPTLPSSQPAPVHYPVTVQTQGGSSGNSSSGGSGGSGSNNTGGLPPGTVPPDGFTLSQLSPFYQHIRLGGVSAGGYGSYAQFSLYGDSASTQGVDVTGWQIRGNRGVETIPQGTLYFDPRSWLSQSDIILGPGQQLVAYGTQSPVGQNFRLNKCVGYLNSLTTFIPQLPENCPQPYTRSEIAGFSGQCQSFIMSLGWCTTPTADQMNQYSLFDYGQCQAILNRFKYSTCYDNHRTDADFLSNQWWVWLGGGINFDPQHDRLNLFDSSGKLVDQYLY